MQFNREVLSVYVKPKENDLYNVVNRVTWRYRVRDDSFFADIYQDTHFNTVNAKKFLNFEDLSEEIIFGWIDDVEDNESIKQQLIENLNATKNPASVEKKIPWETPSKYTGDEEYLIVFDDEANNPLKILGPMKWNSESANRGLKERGVHDHEFPSDIIIYQRELLPIDIPIIVTDRVKIFKVEFTEQPVLDDIFQYHEGISWVTDSGKAVGTYFVIDRKLNDAKEEFVYRVEQKSAQEQNNGVDIVVQGKTIKSKTDLGTRVSLTQQWLMAGEDDSIKCKLNTFDWVTVSKSELKSIIDQLNAHIQSVLDLESGIVGQVNTCDTIEELKEIVRQVNACKTIEELKEIVNNDFAEVV
jgi:hypothetical protein